MTLTNLILNIAENIDQLSSDGSTTVEGRVTEAGITRKINQTYLDELFPLLSDKYPQDFENETYRQNTYTATSTVDATSSGTTLVIDDAVFDNTMEGFTIQNTTDSAEVKIETYTSTTQVTLDQSVSWTTGATIYVRGNEYVLGGSTTDSKEIRAVYVKYESTDTLWTPCARINKQSALKIEDLELYSIRNPKFYLTTQAVNSKLTPVIGFLPYPTNYNGKYKFSYIEKPVALSSGSDTTMLINTGIDQIIIDGVTSWAFRLKEQFKDAEVYERLYKEGKANLIMNYKPKSRSGASVIKMPHKHMQFISRRF